MQGTFSTHWKAISANLQSLELAARRGAVLWLLLPAPSLSAHPISVVKSEALVHRDRMEMKVAVMPEDFLLVYGLYANAQSRIATEDIAKSAEKHKKFLLDGMIVRDADGNRLEGKVVNFEMPTLPADGLPVTELMATTIVYRLEYQLTKQPTHLLFQQHLGGESIAIPALVRSEEHTSELQSLRHLV